MPSLCVAHMPSVTAADAPMAGAEALRSSAPCGKLGSSVLQMHIHTRTHVFFIYEHTHIHLRNIAAHSYEVTCLIDECCILRRSNRQTSSMVQD